MQPSSIHYIWVFVTHHKSDENISLIVNNLAARLPFVLKFGRRVYRKTTVTGGLQWKSTFDKIQDGRQRIKV